MIKLKKGMLVKVRLADGDGVVERVWAEILDQVGEDGMRVRIDNHPTSKAWQFNEEIECPISYILDVWQDEIKEEGEG